LTGGVDAAMIGRRHADQARKTDGDAMTTPHQPTAFARNGEAR